VPVPGELALDLHDPDVVVVDLGNLLGRPVLSEAQLRVQIHHFRVPIVTGNRTQHPRTTFRDRARCHAAFIPLGRW
jgi:hypothetical protein